MSIAISKYSIRVNEGDVISAEVYLPASSKALYVFAHGAGAGMNHSFMKELSQELAYRQIAALRYNFLFTEQKKKRPDFPAVAHKVVEAAIQKAAELFPVLPIFAGGKSFGGRMTSQFLSSHATPVVRGIIFVGFPLHPPGKPSVERADHLQKIKMPMLFLQGSKDALAEWNLIEGVCNSLTTSTLIKLEGADHAFKMPKVKAIPLLADLICKWIENVAE